MVRRFIEQQQFRWAHQRLREVQPDAPAAGEFAIRPSQIIGGEAEPVQNLRGTSFCRISAEVVELGVQSRQRSIVTVAFGLGDRALDLTQRDVAVERPVECRAFGWMRFLIEMRDPPSRRHPNVADFREQTAAQQREQARLPDAVAADERDAVAGMQRQVEVLEQNLAAAFQRNVGNDDHGQAPETPGLGETLERSNAILSSTIDDAALYCPMREMPEYQRFCDSLQDAAPPATVSDELKALWWARNDDWDRAHQIVQDLESTAAANVHAYLHRVEGDLDNAGYWYRRAGVPRSEESLATEWEALAQRLLAQASADSAPR